MHQNRRPYDPEILRNKLLGKGGRALKHLALRGYEQGARNGIYAEGDRHGIGDSEGHPRADDTGKRVGLKRAYLYRHLLGKEYCLNT